MITSRTTLLAAAVAAAAFSGAAPVAAQGSQTAFLPWLGCWQAVSADGGLAFSQDVPILCIRENPDGEGIIVATLAGGAVQNERELRADGELTPVDEGGCSGWESVAWSGDAHRLYLSSETTCEGGQTRATSGLMALTSATQWMEVQAVDAAVEHVPVRARHYRLVTAPEWAPAQVLPRMANRELAIETARAVASAPLGVREVEEAARFVMPEVVQAVLVEGESQFDLDASTLLRLADAGMDEDILDVMVALDNPEVFVMSAEDAAPSRAPTATADPYLADRYAFDATRSYGRYGRYADFGWSYGYDPFFRYGWDSFYSPYGSGYDPYGRWYRGGGGYGTGPIIIIERPGDTEHEPPVYARQLRAVKGQGYTGGGTVGRAAPSGSSARVSPPSTSVGTGTAAGSSSGTTSTGKKAKPRGGGGGGK